MFELRRVLTKNSDGFVFYLRHRSLRFCQRRFEMVLKPMQTHPVRLQHVGLNCKIFVKQASCHLSLDPRWCFDACVFMHMSLKSGVAIQTWTLVCGNQTVFYLKTHLTEDVTHARNKNEMSLSHQRASWWHPSLVSWHRYIIVPLNVTFFR